MNVFYIPNFGYVYNEQIYSNFDNIADKSGGEPILINVYYANDPMDNEIKKRWVEFLDHNDYADY